MRFWIPVMTLAMACGGAANSADRPAQNTHPNLAIVQAYEQLAGDVRATAGDCGQFSSTMYAWLERDGERVLALDEQADRAPRQRHAERMRLSERLRDALQTVSYVGYLCQDSPGGLGAWRDFEKLVSRQLDLSGPDEMATVATR